jgi:hypothetical protein
MMTKIQCPLCDNYFGGECHTFEQTFDHYYDCTMCGKFEIKHQTHINYFRTSSNALDKSFKLLISFDVRRFSDLPYELRGDRKLFTINENYISKRQLNNKFPNAAEQAQSIICYVGDELERNIEFIERLPNNLYLKIGAKSPIHSGALLKELFENRFLTGNKIDTPILVDVEIGKQEVWTVNLESVNLSLSGWERYEAEKRGKFAGNYGFAALKFDDQELDHVLNNHIKPIVKEELKFEIRDMRDVTQAGVIDNIMRQQIRDAAFVIADLTHDNYGAYWEAGYAEGLGKPVIYICEETKFKSAKTHFDTNHCTTVEWHMYKLDLFKKSLVATIRRSLNLFN